MKNYLIRALACDKRARLLFVENTDLIQAICNQPGVRGRLRKTLLGTAVSCASLISGTLKGHQRISFKLKATQPELSVFADVDSLGNVRGYLSEGWLTLPSRDLDGLSLPGVIGDRGYIQVIKDVGMNRAFTGITDMPYGNIVDDLAHYYLQSEQTPTCFANHIEFDADDEIVACRGVLAQSLPGAGEELISQIRTVLNRFPTLQHANEAFRDLPARLFGDIEVMSTEPLQSVCSCSKDILFPMLAGLGAGELKSAVAEHRTIDMVCHACGSTYTFSSDEIARLVAPRRP